MNYIAMTLKEDRAVDFKEKKKELKITVNFFINAAKDVDMDVMFECIKWR